MQVLLVLISCVAVVGGIMSAPYNLAASAACAVVFVLGVIGAAGLMYLREIKRELERHTALLTQTRPPVLTAPSVPVGVVSSHRIPGIN